MICSKLWRVQQCTEAIVNFPHWLHLCGFSAVWMYECCLSPCLDANTLTHSLHLWGFSPVCVRIWRLTLVFTDKVLSHKVHLYCCLSHGDVHNPWIRSAQYYKSKLQWYKTLHILAHVLNSRICFCSSVRLSILCLNKVSRLLNLRSITLPIGEITILAVYLSSHTSSSSSSRVAMPSAYTHFHCITVAMLTKRTS